MRPVRQAVYHDLTSLNDGARDLEVDMMSLFNQRSGHLHYALPPPLDDFRWTALLKIDARFLLESSDGVPATAKAVDLSMSWFTVMDSAANVLMAVNI